MRRRFRATLVVAVFVLLVLPALLAPVNFPTDDALFYMQVARNIATGYGSTFDRITHTNGYHPLWMAPCVLVARLAGGEPEAMLRLAFGIQQLLAAAIVLLFIRLARQLGVRSWEVGASLVAVFFFTGMYGSEAHLNGLFVLASFLALIRFSIERSRRNGALLGGVVGALILARLDNIFLAGAILVAASVNLLRDRTRTIASLGAAAVVVAFVVGPYLILNQWQFGHWVPISGAIKSTFPRVSGDLRNLGVLGLATSGAALLGAVSLARGERGVRRTVLAAAATGVLAHGAYVALFTDHDTHWSWYYVPGTILLALWVSIALDALAEHVPRLPWRTIAAVSACLVLGWGLARDWARYANNRASSHNQLVVRLLAPAHYPRWEVQFARRLTSEVPRGAAVLAFDYPGALAFYSGRRVIPADGLIGGFDYDEEIRAKGLAKYVEDHEVRGYFGELPSTSDSCRIETIFAPIERSDVGSLILCRKDVVLDAAEAVHGVPSPEVALYRIRDVLPPRGVPPGPMKKRGLLW